MSAGVIGVILGLVLGGAAGYVLGVNVGVEAFKQILIEAFNKHLDDDDTLSFAAIKEIIRGEENGDHETD
jgi:hypothetical protein